MRFILLFSLIWFQMDGVFAADPAEDCQTALTSQPQPSNRDLSLFGASPDEIDLGRSFQVEDKFRSVRLPPAIRNQCNAGNCWIQQELALAETSFQIENPDKAPLALDADYMTWAHLRDETLRSIKNVKDDNEAVHIEIGGSHRRYEYLLGEYGVIPEGVWKHHDLGKAKNAIDRLTIELSWLSRILRENINQKEIDMAQAEVRVDQLLNHYFGSAPPKTFTWNNQLWGPQGFGTKYGLISQLASWGSVENLEFPKIYADERDMRRFQTVVALQLRKTQLPIRAAIRWLSCFEDKATGLLSISKFSQVCLNPLFANALTHAEADRFSHAILITGYTIKNGEFLFEFVNSWGEDWGRKGRGTIDSSYWPMVREALMFSSFIKK